jgi:hypothetical protein
VARGEFYKIGLNLTDKVFLHHYETIYGIHLGPLRDKSVRLMEIGLGCYGVNGHAPRGRAGVLWRQYLPKAHISALEYNQACAEKYSNPAHDVIIDNGYHSRKHQIA